MILELLLIFWLLYYYGSGIFCFGVVWGLCREDKQSIPIRCAIMAILAGFILAPMMVFNIDTPNPPDEKESNEQQR